MDNNKQVFKIRFKDVSIAEAGVRARRLRKELMDSSADVHVNIDKDDQSNQDLGSTLIVILGAPAITKIAKGIADYLSRDRGKIIIERDGKIIAEGLTGKDAARIVEAMSSQKKE